MKCGDELFGRCLPYNGAHTAVMKTSESDRTPIGTRVYPNCATHWLTRWSLEGPTRCQPHGASIQNEAIAASDLLLHRNWTFSFEIDRAKQKQLRQSLWTVWITIIIIKEMLIIIKRCSEQADITAHYYSEVSGEPGIANHKAADISGASRYRKFIMIKMKKQTNFRSDI